MTPPCCEARRFRVGQRVKLSGGGLCFLANALSAFIIRVQLRLRPISDGFTLHSRVSKSAIFELTIVKNSV